MAPPICCATSGGTGTTPCSSGSSERGAIATRSARGSALTAGGRTQVREVKAGSSYLGQNDLRVHFGLGQAARIDRLEIRWPNGQNEVIEGAAVNQILTVTEGKGITARTPFIRK